MGLGVMWCVFVTTLLIIEVEPSGLRLEDSTEHVSPEYLQDGKLAARLTCQPKEIRHFHYESESQLWGEAGGTIKLSADLAVHCLGADHGGKYGAEALKYLVELSNIRGIPLGTDSTDQTSTRGPNSALRRSKRNVVGDFFKSTWHKVKCFFKRLFSDGCSEEHRRREDDHTPPPHGDTTLGDPGDQQPGYRDNGNSRPEETTEAPVEEVEIFNPTVFEQEYSLPFEFVQLANGTVPEVRFAANESTDNGARPFKRHLTDVFNTYLDRARPSVEEVSPLGTHRTRYSYKLPSPEAPSTTASPSPDTLTVTRRVQPGDLMSLPSDEPQMNHPKDVHIATNQIQTFTDGEMTASSGKLELSISNKIDRRRRRRSATSRVEHDLTSNLDVKTSFSLQLRKRHKREVEDVRKINDLEKSMNFKGEPLTAPQTADSFGKNRLESLRDKFKEETSTAKYVTDDEYLANTESIATMLEILELENKLQQEKTPNALTPLVKRLVNSEKIIELCITLRSKNCRTALLLLASTGGKQAEKTLVYLVQQPYVQTVALLASTSATLVPKPSFEFVGTLLKEIENNMRRVLVRSALANSVSLLALKRTNRDYFEKHLSELLKEQTKDCHEGELSPSLLDALGNMGTSATTRADLMTLSIKCPGVEAFQTGVIQALKGSLHEQDVQDFFLQVLGDGKNCLTRRTLLETLTVTTRNNQLIRASTWPAKGTNAIDAKLSSLLMSSQADPCSKSPITEYFKLKEDEPIVARALIVSGTRQNGTVRASRQKRRGFWDNEACDDWTKHRPGKSSSPVDGFEVEGEMYNRWSHCDSGSYFGRRMANAEFQGGMFAGVKHPSNPPKYKVEAKMSGEASFLGKRFDVGTISFGLNEKTSTAYVKLLGRTLLDLKESDHMGCTADEFVYRPAEHIPLYVLSIWIVEVSLGIHMGVDAALNFACPAKNVYNFQPRSRVRLGGEGMGRILMLRGGINLGGNFNYNIQTKLQPYPQACFSGRHGFDPMSISIDTWYQFRKLFSDDKWSRRNLWSPNVLKWNIGSTGQGPWTKYFCIIPNDTVTETITGPIKPDLVPEETSSGTRPVVPAPGTTVKPNEKLTTSTTTRQEPSTSTIQPRPSSVPEKNTVKVTDSTTTSASSSGNAGGSLPNSGSSTSSPSNGGLNPTNGGSSTTNGGSDPNNGGSNTTNQGSNPTNGGSNPSNSGSNPTNAGSDPNSGGLNPISGSSTPSLGGSTFINGGSNPSNGGLTPSSGGLTPSNGGSNPSNGGLDPNSGGSDPTNGGVNGGTGGSNTESSKPSSGSIPTNGGTGTNSNTAGSSVNGPKPSPPLPPIPTVVATIARGPETTTIEAAVIVPNKIPETLGTDYPEGMTMPVFVVKAP